MQDKIIAAIAAYLEKETLIEYVSGESDFQTRYQFAAEQIASAIAPLVEAGEPDWKDVVKIQDESTYTFNLVISGVVVGYASKAGLQSKYTFHPAQHLALSAAHLNAIAAAINYYNQ